METSKDIDNEALYPWDGKGITSVKCIYTWIKFEKILNFPAHELVKNIELFHKVDRSTSSTVKALDILEQLKNDKNELVTKNANLFSANRELEQSHIKLSRQSSKRALLLTISGVVSYFLLAFLFQLLSRLEDVQIFKIVTDFVLGTLIIHSTFLATIFSVFWRFRPQQKKSKSKRSVNKNFTVDGLGYLNPPL